MASCSDAVHHFNLKFYQRYIDPGLVVEPMSLSGFPQSTRKTSSSSTSTRSTKQARPRNSASSGGTSGSGDSTTSSAGPSPTTLRCDRQTIQFAVNAWIFVLAVLAIIPLLPSNLSNRDYRLCFIGTACTSLYSLYSLYGTPRAWNLQAVQLWLQSVIVTKDFIYYMYLLVFVTSHLSLKFALLPILCRSVEHVAKFLRRNFNRSTLYRWQRNFIQTFMYWHLLKLMYHAPVTAGYHKSVWAKIGASTLPSIAMLHS